MGSESRNCVVVMDCFPTETEKFQPHGPLSSRFRHPSCRPVFQLHSTDQRDLASPVVWSCTRLKQDGRWTTDTPAEVRGSGMSGEGGVR